MLYNFIKYITFTDFLFDENIDYYNIFKNYEKIKIINFYVISFLKERII